MYFFIPEAAEQIVKVEKREPVGLVKLAELLDAGLPEMVEKLVTEIKIAIEK